MRPHHRKSIDHIVSNVHFQTGLMLQLPNYWFFVLRSILPPTTNNVSLQRKVVQDLKFELIIEFSNRLSVQQQFGVITPSTMKSISLQLCPELQNLKKFSSF